MYDRKAKKAVTKEVTAETPSHRPSETEKTDEPEKIDKPEKKGSPAKTYTAKPVIQREQKPEAKPVEIHSGKTHHLLEEMLKHLKRQNRTDMFEDFSILKFVAGAVQSSVFFCLLLSLWFLMDPQRTAETVHTAIGYAIVLQLMAIAFYIMRDRK